MDKFGIFNILNSFLGSLNGKNGETKDSSSDSPDYLKTISSFFDNANSAKNSEKPADIPKTGEKSGKGGSKRGRKKSKIIKTGGKDQGISWSEPLVFHNFFMDVALLKQCKCVMITEIACLRL